MRSAISGLASSIKNLKASSFDSDFALTQPRLLEVPRYGILLPMGNGLNSVEDPG